MTKRLRPGLDREASGHSLQLGCWNGEDLSKIQRNGGNRRRSCQKALWMQGHTAKISLDLKYNLESRIEVREAGLKLQSGLIAGKTVNMVDIWYKRAAKLPGIEVFI